MSDALRQALLAKVRDHMRKLEQDELSPVQVAAALDLPSAEFQALWALGQRFVLVKDKFDGFEHL